MSTIRLARALTGATSCSSSPAPTHGHVDGLLAEAGSGLATAACRGLPGVPAAATANTVIVPWNDPDAAAAALAEHEFAADPVRALPGQHGVRAAAGGLPERLRDGRHRQRALLVFDEVISGFRVAPGGAQELTGVLPDITVMGEIIGGGLPAAAYGASVELMPNIVPAGDVYQAGTLSGNPLATAAGAGRARAARRRGLRAPLRRRRTPLPRGCGPPPATRPSRSVTPRAWSPSSSQRTP